MSQPERSSEERDEQPKNVWDRSVTLDVSQQETSKAKSEEQLQNVSCRFLSLGTVQPVRLRVESELQSLNMLDMSSTLDTSRPVRSMLAQLSNPQNRVSTPPLRCTVPSTRTAWILFCASQMPRVN